MDVQAMLSCLRDLRAARNERGYAADPITLLVVVVVIVVLLVVLFRFLR